MSEREHAIGGDLHIELTLSMLQAELGKARDFQLREALVAAQLVIEKLRTPDLHIRMPESERDRANLVLLHDVPKEHFASYPEDYGRVVPFLTLRNLGQKWAVARPTVYNHATRLWDMNVHWFTSKVLADRCSADAQLGIVPGASVADLDEARRRK